MDNRTSQTVEIELGKPIEQLAKKLTGQKATKSTRREVNKSNLPQADLSESQTFSNSESQQVNKLTIRKSTFQLSVDILKRLDVFHLQLQLELGKADAPYKETIVEEAIAQFLDRASKDRAEMLPQLRARQSRR